MTIAQVEATVEPAVTEVATDADFKVAPHRCEWLYAAPVCSVCGRITQWHTDTTGNFQDPFPSFGSDEYLGW